MASPDQEVAHRMNDEVYKMAPPPSVDSFSLSIHSSMASWDLIKYTTFQLDLFLLFAIFYYYVEAKEV